MKNYGIYFLNLLQKPYMERTFESGTKWVVGLINIKHFQSSKMVVWSQMCQYRKSTFIKKILGKKHYNLQQLGLYLSIVIEVIQGT